MRLALPESMDLVMTQSETTLSQRGPKAIFGLNQGFCKAVHYYRERFCPSAEAMPRNREAPIRANCTVHLRLQPSPPFLFKCLRQTSSFRWAWRSHAQQGRSRWGSSQCEDGRPSLLLIREAGWTRLVHESSVQTSDVRPLPTTVPTGNGSRSSFASI
ncbi:MAG: hypothetical protein QOH35_218 [Acidobacteriaceae bacterium]|nr:hypothetical protein [Acidobacteriaceae bacterium]